MARPRGTWLGHSTVLLELDGARVLFDATWSDLPIHWGTHNLAFHAWDEPAERTIAAAESSDATLVMPRPEETIEPWLVTIPVERC